MLALALAARTRLVWAVLAARVLDPVVVVVAVALRLVEMADAAVTAGQVFAEFGHSHDKEICTN